MNNLTKVLMIGLVALLPLVITLTVRTANTYYFDLPLRVVSITYQGQSLDELQHFVVKHAIVLESLTTPSLRKVIVTGGIRPVGNISSEWVYTHKPGEIVQFDYISQAGFYRVDRQTRSGQYKRLSAYVKSKWEILLFHLKEQLCFPIWVLSICLGLYGCLWLHPLRAPQAVPLLAESESD